MVWKGHDLENTVTDQKQYLKYCMRNGKKMLENYMEMGLNALTHLLTSKFMINPVSISCDTEKYHKQTGAAFSAWNIIAFRDTVCDML